MFARNHRRLPAALRTLNPSRRFRQLWLESMEPRRLLASLAGGAADFVPREILVGFTHEVANQAGIIGLNRAFDSATAGFRSAGLERGEWLSKGRSAQLGRDGLVARFDLQAGKDMQQVARELSQLPGVAYAEPNYLWSTTAVPDDTNFVSLWGLHNTGQTGGTSDADIDAVEAWDLGTGSRDIIVGIIDTGVDYDHPDLAANIWKNPGECLGAGGSCVSDGIDNDGNGYVDDFHGINAITGSGDPMDDNGHGTHVAGTIGAVGDNQLGVSGVNHEVSIVACKFLGATGSGATTDAVECFEYFTGLKQAGYNVVVTNNSWSGAGFSQALVDVMAGPVGMDPILHAAAAGNSKDNNDTTPNYPASYGLTNIISVAATDNADSYASFSGYGSTTIDVAAPGVSILSTSLNDGYASLSGTSMATPHVAGAAALVKSLHPAMTASQLKQVLINGTDIVSDPAKVTVSSGRLNVHQSLTNLSEVDVTSPSAVTDLSVVDVGMLSASLAWTATGDDASLGQARMYDVRFSTSPITAANWSTATPALGEPRPGSPGTSESFNLKGLQRDTNYYYALKVLDNLGNESPISNLTSQRTALGETMLADGFEGGLSNWTAESPWGLTTSVRNTGNYSVTDSPSGNYASNANASLTSSSIDLTGVYEAHLTFWHRYNLEQGFDDGHLEVSLNGGTTWTTLASYTGAVSSFQKAEFDLTPYAGSPAVLVRFRLESDSSIQRDGWYIDDVSLSGMRTPGVQISNSSVLEGSGGPTQLEFTVTRIGNPSTAFTVDYQTVSDTTTAMAVPGIPSFNRHAITNAADSVASVVAADLDDDGDLDIVSASINDDTIAWQENDGNGNFTAHVITSTADGARSVVTADVDSDGDIDVLSASWFDDTIAWYENNGGGSFVAHVITNTADGTQSVFAADMDGDGDIDVLSASTADDTVAWYENDGSQSFTFHPITTALDYANSVYAVDLDGDGDQDVMSASVFGDAVQWYENDGNQNFVVHQLGTTVDNPWSIFPSDLDGDGDVDVLVASAEDDTIRWFENLGNADFASHVVTTTADNLRSVHAADMDADGDIDILSASMNDDTVAWYENDGNGSFVFRPISLTADGAGAVFAADVDGDGDLDVLAGSRLDDSIAWFSNSLINPQPGDYQAASGTLSFAAGEMEKSITITVFGDAEIEGDETLFVTLANATAGMVLADGLGTGTILNDDQPLVLLADSFEVGEWNSLWVEDSQNDWFRSTQRATDGSWSAEVDGSATNATLTTVSAIDLSGSTSATLSFDWLIESGFDAGEYLSLDISTNGGASWIQDIRLLNGNVDTENVWHAETVDLTAFASSNLKIRFRSKVSASDEDANVDNVRITAIPAGLNTPPNAVAGGPYSVNEGGPVTLSASGSTDSDGTISTYAWDFNGDGQYDDASGASVNFATDQSGSHVIGLRVTDNRGATATTTTTVAVNNVAPTANAGADQSAFKGGVVNLSAASSTDPGNDIVGYAWDLNGNGQYTNATGVDATFSSAVAGVFTVSVKVTDADGAVSYDSATIAVADASTKFYVVNDATSDTTYEYAADGTSIENYGIDSGNSAPRGAASNAAGTSIWVADKNRKVFVYDAAGGLKGSWSAGSLASNAQVEGLATNGTDVWIVDNRSDKVYRYSGAANRTSGSQNAASSFSLSNTNPKGIVTDGTHLWVVNDGSTDKVFKYTLSGSLVGSWTIDTVNKLPTGLTIDPSGASQSIWIVDNGTDKVYEYANARVKTTGSFSASTSFALAAGNSNPQGIADPPPPANLQGVSQQSLQALPIPTAILVSQPLPAWSTEIGLHGQAPESKPSIQPRDPAINTSLYALEDNRGLSPSMDWPLEPTKAASASDVDTLFAIHGTVELIDDEQLTILAQQR